MGGRTLTQGLDTEIYQVIRKLKDEQAQYDGKGLVPTTPKVYDRIKKSNSSLNRKSKKLLEDSISRVLAVVREDEIEDDLNPVEGDFGSMRDEPPTQDINLVNKSIVGKWAVSRSQKSGTASPIITTPLDGSDENPKGHTPLPIQSITASDRTTTSVSKRRERAPDGKPVTKRRKGERTVKDADRSPPTHISLEDLGGVDSVIRDLTELIAWPMLCPVANTILGTEPPRGVLLFGPPGCGKTMIANAFAARIGVSFIPISAPSIVSGMSGESEKKLRDYFDEARNLAPCLMFIDEIDAITPKRESAQREMEKRIVAQMLTCMDDLALDRTNGRPVIIIAATNRPDSLDPALRRAGRFNKEINLSVPNEVAREKILKALTRGLRLSGDFDFRELAKRTPGFVGADLKDLVSTAGVAATKKVFELLVKREVMEVDGELRDDSVSPEIRVLDELIERAKGPLSAEEREGMTITNDDFLNAIPKIQPSSKREGFATIPNTTWADIGALHSIRKELQMAIVEPIKRPERFEKFGVTAPTGVLLWGPPGCGKTLLAKAVANESRANFISVKGPELLNKYFGESERAVRQVFVRARSSVPCVVFFDELDAIVPTRDYSGGEASARIVNTMLSELDGLGNRAGIYVIAATNRPDAIDPALLRPGRLGTLLFVDLPGPEERAEILQTLMKMPTTANIEEVGRLCEGFNGADLESLLREASIAAMCREDEVDRVEQSDFDTAVTRVRRSVSEEEEKKYRRMRGRWGFTI
ncbi:MAG: hypothetical protein M1837_004774 [Sclerophora amabilis]|nr:MAG: hypothetical protein M1837_004774 [Sclerophora amabilis]